MLSLFDGLREVTLASAFVRLTLAVLCGGIIGMERSYKRRPAGFRTHILICIGAAITTLTSQYLYLNMHYFTDMARLGAQVVAGIGFIGAGTIIVTRRQRVKGLTTAAGLWTCAIIGLALGGGFSYVFQPTFGFLLGLIPSAWLIGLLSRNTTNVWRIALACVAGLAVLYAIGVPYLALIANGYLGKGLTFWQILRSGMLIYLPGDALKIAVCVPLCLTLRKRVPQLVTA